MRCRTAQETLSLQHNTVTPECLQCVNRTRNPLTTAHIQLHTVNNVLISGSTTFLNAITYTRANLPRDSECHNSIEQLHTQRGGGGGDREIIVVGNDHKSRLNCVP